MSHKKRRGKPKNKADDHAAMIKGLHESLVEAFTQSCMVLKNHLGAFVNLEDVLVEVNNRLQDHSNPERELRELLAKPPLELSVFKNNSSRVLDFFDYAKISTLGELIKMKESEVKKFPNLGRKSFNEISKKLNELGFCFGMNVDGYIK